MKFRPRPAGFTLLELLVVLAMAALLAALMLPNVLGWSYGAKERAWRGELQSTLRAWPVLAHQQGTELVVDGARLKRHLPSLPADAELVMDRPLRYQPNGLASAGVLRIRRPGLEEEVWQVQALTGEPVRL